MIKTHHVSKNGPRLISHQLSGWCWHWLRLTFLEEAYFKGEGSGTPSLCILFPDHTTLTITVIATGGGRGVAKRGSHL